MNKVSSNKNWCGPR